MINSKILVSVVIVLMIGVAAAGYQISQTPQLWQLTTPQSSDSSSQGDSQSSSSPSDVVQGQSSGSSSSSVSSQGSSSSGGSSVKVSSSEAKKIAEGYIQQEGAVAGTPVIKTIGGKKVYVVPVQMNGENVGEIYIDPSTGKNVGGAGGAP
ncbi:MAG: peptidase propeptide domain-containing protein [Methanobacteriales archaeon HGW-Methanobacteriales-1]|jgi:cytoskeletal protein RodZ|nr:MAG: peptidase propeptide domain-containing protein [Methanobacteriales archaeon HGW-Methanobacteriales-1]